MGLTKDYAGWTRKSEQHTNNWPSDFKVGWKLLFTQDRSDVLGAVSASLGFNLWHTIELRPFFLSPPPLLLSPFSVNLPFRSVIPYRLQFRILFHSHPFSFPLLFRLLLLHLLPSSRLHCSGYVSYIERVSNSF